MYTFKLFGKLLIERDHCPATMMNSPKGAALIVYLILHKEPQLRELIADLFWDAKTTQKSLASLRALIKRVRKLFPELIATRKQLGIDIAAELSVDLYQLETALDSNDLAQIDEALPLYTGDLLMGYYLEDAPRFDEWLILERERWRQRVMGAYGRLCQFYTEQEDWLKGISAAQRWLSLDELDEVALQYLLQFLAATGQVDLALQQFEISRQRLWEELEVDPLDETLQLVRLLQQLQDSRSRGVSWETIVGAQLERPSPDQLPDLGLLPSNTYIPYQHNKDFTGRTTSLLHLARLLLPSTDGKMRDHRAVAITGMGGLGKSQLAVEFCYRYGRFFPGGVFWLSFAEPDSVPEEIAQIGGERGMGLYREADNLKQIDKIGRVTKAWQEAIPRLLIFDNCEEEALVANWLPVSGGCSVLLTSRRAYWSRELQVSEHSLPYFNGSESVHLLQNLMPTLMEKDALAIAIELGHLPLALHLAGSFLRRYQRITAVQYLAQLHDKTLLSHPSLRGYGAGISPTGHELDVARTFAVNWEQLDPTNDVDTCALQLLAHAAQFAPSEPLERALLISTLPIEADDLMQTLLVEDGISRLISLGFVNQDDVGYLTIHRLIIAFVKAMLPDTDVSKTAVAQAIYTQVHTYFSTHDTHDQLPLAATHYLHVLHNELAKSTPEGSSMACDWGLHLMDIGDLTNAHIYLQKALAIAEEQYGLDDVKTADVLRALATVAWQIESAQAAKPYAERALAIYRQAYGNEHFTTGQSLNNLAIIHARLGNAKTAIDHYQQALTILEKLNPEDNIEIPRIHYNLGITYYRQGNFTLALSHCSVALAYYRKIFSPDHPQLLQPLVVISIIQLLVGNYDEAHQLCQQTLALQRTRLGESHPQTSSTLSISGVVLYFLNKPIQATENLQQSLAIREKIYGKAHRQLVYTLTWLGHLLCISGDSEQGRVYLERGLAIQEDEGVEDEETAETLTRLAELYQQQNECEQALTYLKRAMTIWDNNFSERHPNTAVTLIRLGEYYEAQDDIKLAKTYYEQAQTLLVAHVTEKHYEQQRVKSNLAKLPVV